MSRTVVIERRFNGPPESGHGGLACGRFASCAAGLADGPAEGPALNVVTLHTPPPLDVPLQLRRSGGRVHVWDGETLVASLSRSDQVIRTIPLAPPADIAAAERRYVSASRHPFPTCFVCGPLRPDTDGLRLAPGLLPGRTDATACTWVPADSLGADSGQRLPVEFAWAAMDCPGGWTADLALTPMVLNRFAVVLADAPRVGTPYVIVGERDRDDGHTMTTTTALYQHDGTLVGRSLARWTRIAPEVRSRESA
jgi:hypothetical protein